MEYREFKCRAGDDYPGGVVQVVERPDDQCIVGYKRNDDSRWQHWGAGEGGYKATCQRFEDWLEKEAE